MTRLPTRVLPLRLRVKEPHPSLVSCYYTIHERVPFASITPEESLRVRYPSFLFIYRYETGHLPRIALLIQILSVKSHGQSQHSPQRRLKCPSLYVFCRHQWCNIMHALCWCMTHICAKPYECSRFGDIRWRHVFFHPRTSFVMKVAVNSKITGNDVAEAGSQLATMSRYR